jgi:hypothetical protein
LKRTTKPRKKRISPASAKNKGRALQKWVCQHISDLTGFPWGSSGDDCPIESRPMGQKGCDVRMESQVVEAFPFSVECKWQETWSIPAWIKQAKENQMEGTDWLLFCRRSREKEIVVLDAEVFFRILKERKI